MSEQINWEEQWAYFAPQFHQGKAHISLSNGEEIQLIPGPGFGDFSHPTTRLMLEILTEHTPYPLVLDIGCGSGILSIAAKKLGAKQVYSLDIDPNALKHTKKNAALNQVELNQKTPSFFPTKPLILMNMITSEQKTAWNTYSCPFHILVTSGILITEREEYLEFAQQNNWQLIQEHQANGWLACQFKEISL